jgi:hypothetical protein
MAALCRHPLTEDRWKTFAGRSDRRRGCRPEVSKSGDRRTCRSRSRSFPAPGLHRCLLCDRLVSRRLGRELTHRAGDLERHSDPFVSRDLDRAGERQCRTESEPGARGPAVAELAGELIGRHRDCVLRGHDGLDVPHTALIGVAAVVLPRFDDPGVFDYNTWFESRIGTFAGGPSTVTRISNEAGGGGVGSSQQTAASARIVTATAFMFGPARFYRTRAPRSAHEETR